MTSEEAHTRGSGREVRVAQLADVLGLVRAAEGELAVRVVLVRRGRVEDPDRLYVDGALSTVSVPAL
jgi:hypothetical protein